MQVMKQAGNKAVEESKRAVVGRKRRRAVESRRGEDKKRRV